MRNAEHTAVTRNSTSERMPTKRLRCIDVRWVNGNVAHTHILTIRVNSLCEL